MRPLLTEKPPLSKMQLERIFFFLNSHGKYLHTQDVVENFIIYCHLLLDGYIANERLSSYPTFQAVRLKF